MKTLGNLLWHFPFFGFLSAVIVYLLGILLAATVVAAPIGLGLMQFGKFLFFPFGHEMISKAELQVEQNATWKAYSMVVTIVYLPFGVVLAICAAIQVFFLFCTIIGIPVGLVIAKSLGTYLNPVNKKCVSSAVAREVERRAGEKEVEKYLGPAAGAPPTAAPPQILAVTTPPLTSVPASSELKTCPRCAEEIKAAAKVCRFCDHEMSPDEDPTPAATKRAEAPDAPAAASSTATQAPQGDQYNTHDGTTGPKPANPALIRVVAVAVAFLLVVGMGYNYFRPKVDPQVQQASLQELERMVTYHGTALSNDSAGEGLMLRYLDSGGSPNAQVGHTALLSIAAQSGYTKVTKRLLEMHANLETGSDGSPLYWTVVARQHDPALLLIEAGADVNAMKSGGWTVLDAAHSEMDANDPKTKKLIEALRAKGAKHGRGNDRQLAAVPSTRTKGATPAVEVPKVSGGASTSLEAPPPIQVGDRYVYETQDLVNPKLNNVVAREVVGKERGEFVVRFVNQKSGYTRINRFTDDWSFAGSNIAADESTVIVPPLQYLKFPMRQGERWSTSHTETNTKTGKVRIHKLSGAVEGTERVSTPAGTFDAIRIVLRTTTQDGDKSISGTDTSWYVPALKRPVRAELTSTEGDTGNEGRRIIQLLSYSLK